MAALGRIGPKLEIVIKEKTRWAEIEVQRQILSTGPNY
jgi:hypothetical protein